MRWRRWAPSAFPIPKGGFNQRGIDYYVERARGGTALIITGVTFVDNQVEKHAMPSVPCPTHNGIHFVRTARELTERIHSYDARIFLQMSAGGRVTIPTNLGDHPPVAPSPIPHRWLNKTCRALSKEEIRHIVRMFGIGAVNAKRAGFDGVEIHAGHEGYLLDQFAISFFNRRTDEYGGSLENRLRFAREVVEEIKERCGDDFPVALRYSVKSFIKDWREGGLPGETFDEKGRDVEEGIEAAKLLVSYGYDALDVDVGSYDAWWWSHPPMYMPKGLYIPYAKRVKETVDVPVICAGRMDNPDLALDALVSGACDIIGLGRPLLADLEYVNKLRAGKRELIRPCLSCHEGCMGRIQEYSSLGCAVNPAACREREARLTPALQPKKVMIIGGGVAGCEAARVLKLRGHEPVLYEKGDRLGGNLLAGGVPDFKEDDRALAAWYENVLRDLQVRIKLNTPVTADMVREENPDAVIVATGSIPKRIPLGDGNNTFTATEVLLGEKTAGERTVVVGGGLVGCELALWLAKKGKQVTLVEEMDELLAANGPLCHANSDMLKALIPHYGIKVLTSTKVIRATEKGVLVHADGEETEIEADTVVLAIGFDPDKTLYDELKHDFANIHRIGDSRRVANIMYAIWDAYEVASSL